MRGWMGRESGGNQAGMDGMARMVRVWEDSRGVARMVRVQQESGWDD